MKSDPRVTSLLAAAVAAALLASAPATAAENAATDVSAKAVSATRHVPARIATPRYVRSTPGHFDCTGNWCGRHFVLMVGIAY